MMWMSQKHIQTKIEVSMFTVIIDAWSEYFLYTLALSVQTCTQDIHLA